MLGPPCLHGPSPAMQGNRCVIKKNRTIGTLFSMDVGYIRQSPHTTRPQILHSVPLKPSKDLDYYSCLNLPANQRIFLCKQLATTQMKSLEERQASFFLWRASQASS